MFKFSNSRLAAAAAVLVLLGLQTNAAHSVPVNVSDTQAITADGQTFNFDFSVPASSLAGGQMTIILDGDYSRSGADELASFTLDIAGGNLVLAADASVDVNGIFANSISGLTLNSFTSNGGGNDINLNWVFDISAALLGEITADNSITAVVQNDPGVTFSSSVDDFVSLSFSFEAPASVPEPGTLALFGISLAGLGYMRRRRKQT